MNASTLSEFDDSQADYDEYRALSISAVVTAVLGVISLPVLVLPGLLVIPGAGLLVGIYSLRKLTRCKNELIGINLAKAGTLLSASMLLVGTAIAGYTYATEVPEGYRRISFRELRPDPKRPDPKRPDLPVSPTAVALNGAKVFVKGYILPDERKTDLKRFVLVPDMKSCCFGGNPKITDMIEVTLRDPQRVNYSLKRQRLAGVLKVDTRPKPVSGLRGVYFQLDADYVK